MEVNVILENKFQEADKHLLEKRYQKAYDLLQEILKEDPVFGKAYNHLGWLFETKYRRHQEAENFYKLAMKHSPEYLSTYYNYAIVLSTHQRWDELRDLLVAALKVSGCNKATIYNEYGIMFELLEEWQKAIKAFDKAILATVDNKRIEKYQKSIDRVRFKMDTFE